MHTHDSRATSSAIFQNLPVAAVFQQPVKMLGALLTAAAMTIALTAGTAQLAHAKNEPVTDRSFVQDSFRDAQADIAISKVALEKSKSQQTKKLAKAVIKESDTANAKLRELATTRRVEIPTALDKDQLQQVAQLQSSDPKTVDALYRQHMQQQLTASIQLFDLVARNPRADAELRVFASQRLPLFKKHQQMLEKMAGTAAQRQAGL